MDSADPKGPKLFVATANERQQRRALWQQPSPRGRIPRANTDGVDAKKTTHREGTYTLQAEKSEGCAGFRTDQKRSKL